MTEAASDRPVEGRKVRDLVWFRVHSWVGLKFSVLMTFILFTGTMAVFSSEIDWLLNPEMRADARDDGPVAWGRALDTVNAVLPGVQIRSLQRRADPWFALEALVESPWKDLARAWVDPQSGRFQGLTPWKNVQRFFRTTHRHLMLPTKIGIPIVTSLALPLLIALVAGLVVYKRFWRGFFKWPRFNRSTRIWAGDLHRLSGLWSSWLIVVMVVTSLWYLVEVLGGRAPRLPSADPAGSVIVSSELSGERLDAMVSRAGEIYPELAIRRILLPERPGKPVVIMGDLSATLVRPRANAVVFDPATGDVIAHYRGEDLGIHTRISEAADPLHFGYFGGLWTKALWFTVGLAMTALSVTGCVVYGKRLARSAQSKHRRRLTPAASALAGAAKP